MEIHDTERAEKIIEEIKNKPVLYIPSLNEPFRLKTDASDKGVGAVLFQNKRLVGYYSSSYKKSEENYTVIEKETLGMLKALSHFRPLILNSKIIIFTDNKNLIIPGDLSKRINRWKLIMEEYDYELKHIAGTENRDADILSRSALKNIENYTSLEHKDIKYQEESRYPLLDGHEFFTHKWDPCSITQNEKRISSFIKTIHCDLVHPGIAKMTRTLERCFGITGIRKIIQKICNSCSVCNLEKTFRSNYGIPDYKINVSEPNEVLAIDIKAR